MIEKSFLDYLYKQRQIAIESVKSIEVQMSSSKTPEHFEHNHTHSVIMRDAFDTIIKEYISAHTRG